MQNFRLRRHLYKPCDVIFAQKIHFFTQILKNCTAVSFYSNKLKLSKNTDKCIIFKGLKVYFDPMPITCSNSPSQSSQMSKKNEK